MRHGVATLLLPQKVPLFDVPRVLGHSEIDTTSNVYEHLVEDMTAGAAATMDGLLRRAKA